MRFSGPKINEKQGRGMRYNRSYYELRVRLIIDYSFIQQAYVFHSHHSPNRFCQMQLAFPGDLISGFSILCCWDLPGLPQCPLHSGSQWVNSKAEGQHPGDFMTRSSKSRHHFHHIHLARSRWPETTATGIRKSCLQDAHEEEMGLVSIKIWIVSPKKYLLVF